MHLLQANVNGNPNIGLYMYATNEYCLAGLDIPKKTIDHIKEVLKVPVHQLNLCGTSLIGVFCVGNSHCLLLPSIAFDSELRILDKLNINYKIIETRLTALGNNILCNDKGCLVNPDFSAVIKKKIRQALNVPLNPGTIADLPTVGSLAVFNHKFGVVHHDITDPEMDKITELLGIQFDTATINLGNPFIRSGLVSNNNGFVIGSQSTGIEMTHIDQALGFLE